MRNHEKLYHMTFKDLYPNYVLKAERKGRTKEEVDEILCWLTGHNITSLHKVLSSEIDVQTFFNDAPNFNRKADLIKGVICGVRIEDIEDPLMKRIRYLDKLIDELAKSRPMSKILREE
ncbi:MAG: DUF2200 domain-containing protein [Bacillota bacterium]|nr:MAG: DUF2200 domain-containing protein [Bacillota bacterium]